MTNHQIFGIFIVFILNNKFLDEKNYKQYAFIN